jgi:hypothetical protein
MPCTASNRARRRVRCRAASPALIRNETGLHVADALARQDGPGRARCGSRGGHVRALPGVPAA